jgi:hypothetical protein
MIAVGLVGTGLIAQFIYFIVYIKKITPIK